MVCPLCTEKKYLTLRRYAIANLSEIWNDNFGFDPFNKFPAGATLSKLSCVECGLIYFSPEFYGDGEFYAKLSKYDWYYEGEKWEFDKALDIVQQVRPKSVLEIGCGSGEFLQKISSGVEYSLGVDINEAALVKARQKGLQVISTGIYDLTHSFDMVFLFQVLEHLQSPGEFLRTVEGKLNPGGVLVIAVPNPDGYLKDMGTVALDMPPHHNTGWKKETFTALAKLLNMELLSYETERLRYIHYQGLLSVVGDQGTSKRYLRMTQKLMSKILGPLFYASGGNQLVGQTHLVALRKKI